jgi:glyoxylase-like metal-dependent hydrolase (beta-lactamase superfamily II)
MMRFNIGEVTATVIEERIDRTFDLRKFLPMATDEALEENLHWMAPHHYEPDSGRMLLSMHSWLVDTGRQKILIDGCVGNGKDRPGRPDWCGLDTPFLKRLEAAGATPYEIDYVLCTHLHADHVGWNTRLVGGEWVPTFPSAKYVFSAQEHRYWQTRYEHNPDDAALRAFEDSVLPVIRAGQALIVDGPCELAGCLHVEPASGHTPGHVAIWLVSGASRGVFTGDILHHPLQVKYPAWSTSGCIDPQLAAQTRTRILQRTVSESALLLPAHFMSPHVCTVHAHGDGFDFRFVEL